MSVRIVIGLRIEFGNGNQGKNECGGSWDSLNLTLDVNQKFCMQCVKCQCEIENSFVIQGTNNLQERHET
jgi:hypothetical protein